MGMDVAGKLHTGRSRNDQSGTVHRLWLRDNLVPVEEWLRLFVEVLMGRSEVEVEQLMPGYTHLQRAHPVRWSHFLLNPATPFVSDLE